MFKSFRYQIYPNKAQQNHIHKTFGCCRFVYNYFLSIWDEELQRSGEGLTYSVCSSMLTLLKKDADKLWLREVDSIALQSAIANLSVAFERFSKRISDKPNFKKKNACSHAYTTKYTRNNIEVLRRKVKIPKVGWIKKSGNQPITGKILRATITKKSSGKYFISILCDTDIKPYRKTDCAVGIDLGISSFATLSSGVKIDNYKFSHEISKKLKREQRKLSRMSKQAKLDGRVLSTSKNYQKQRKKVALLHEKVVNRRRDFLQKLSTDIVKNHDTICVEDLKVKNMMSNRKMSKCISDASWSSFIRMLTYKSIWSNRCLIKVSPWYPSTQICNICGHRMRKICLGIQRWKCTECENSHDRDINASLNILKEGLRLFKYIQPQGLRG